MPRVTLALVVAFVSTLTVGQTAPTSDPLAVSLVQQAVTALTGGLPISDLTLTGTVTSIAGSDNETGTGTFQAKGFAESRIDLKLSGGTRSDVRNPAVGGAWQVDGAASKPYAGHNCRTDAAWFFPTLSSLAQAVNQNFIFKYIGQELHGSVQTQHIRVFKIFTGDMGPTLERLGTEDIYLDLTSGLPDAITFELHPDNDLNTNIDAEIRFANYRVVTGVLVPFHFQRMINGGVVLDVTVSSVAVNTGLADSLFSLQ